MKDLPKIWKPFTVQGPDTPEPTKVVKGDGIWLELDDGTRLMDLISSWWVNLHGHAHPKIAQAIAEQAARLEHVIFAGYTHQPAEDLAEKLIDLTNGHFGHVFFSDNGSTAVEVALKTARQYWVNRGQSQRNRLIAFEGAYHGDTFGAMAAGARSAFSSPFDVWLTEVDRVDYPDTWIGDDSIHNREDASIGQLNRLLEQHPGEYASIIIEPLVQGAGGMRMCRPEFLKRLEQLANRHDIMVIYDEIMTGFGRTGPLFAYQKAGTRPDLICLSKGLTGGFVPMALTLSTTRVFESFYASDPAKTLWHGHSYTGNPIGCAAALASLELTIQAEEATQRLSEWQSEEIQQLSDAGLQISRLRCTGTIAAFDVAASGQSGYFSEIGPKLKRLFPQKGLLLRPLGNVLYLMPPYCITRDELRNAYKTIAEVLQAEAGSVWG